MVRSSSPDPNASAGKLKVSRPEVAACLLSQVEPGRELTETYYRSYDELDDAIEECESWDESNQSFLRQLFEGLGPLRNYLQSGPLRLDKEDYLATQAVDFKNHVDGRLAALTEVLDELYLYDEPSNDPADRRSAGKNTPGTASNEVFIVHGTDQRWKQEVARFLEKGGAKPIILHEQATSGRTIIEKLEHYSRVAYTVVIMTPDDLGGPLSTPPGEYQPRARQNVIFELGYFLGRAERQRVCALYAEGVEIPSDYSGVVYIPLDSAEGWKMSVARELRAAGVVFDLDRATG